MGFHVAAALYLLEGEHVQCTMTMSLVEQSGESERMRDGGKGQIITHCNSMQKL